MDGYNSNKNQDTRKLKRIIYVLLLLFVVLIGFLIWQMREKSQTYSQNMQMKDELTELMKDYESIKTENAEFQSQLSERDSIILANSQEIQQLINSQADYRKVKRKLELLRGITQDYVRRIDSLIIVNEELMVENIEIKKEISVEREKNRELTKEKTQLDEKVTQASTLKAYNLKAYALRTRGKSETETNKAARADKITVDFTLSENKIVPSGERSIYVRIARPDGMIISLGDSDAYSFEMNGTTLQYTVKKDIVYENTAQHIQMSWMKQDLKTPAMTGIYNISVFADNHEIGRTSFELK